MLQVTQMTEIVVRDEEEVKAEREVEVQPVNLMQAQRRSSELIELPSLVRSISVKSNKI